MSIPDPVPKLHEGFGVVAYRWIVGAMAAITLYGVAQTYAKIDKMFDRIGDMGGSIIAVNGRLDAQAARIDGHDRKFEQYDGVLLRAYRENHP